MADANRRLVLEAWNMISGEKRLEAFEDYFADDYVRHGEAGDYSRAQLREIMVDIQQAFPDLIVSIVDVVADADRVAYRWESAGTHAGTYMGVPATNKRIAAEGMNIVRIDGGRIAEEWGSWSKSSFLHNLGIIEIG
jgi:steroid delta-isomerase-like uncharacterized protein